MQPVYYGEHAPYKYSKSIFLAGPSLRSGQEGVSWRKDALQILEHMGYDGVVFIPENRQGRLDEHHDYDQTVKWEETHLEMADVILFWVPRKMDTLPALTTNIEFGRYESSGKVILGYPEDAERMHYLHTYAKKLNIPISHTLTHTIQATLDKLGEGAERSLGERFIPLSIWKTKTFQQWYRNLLKAGNRLETAKVLFNFRPKNKDFTFLWIVHPVVYIASEDRFKSNEMVIARTDISSVCLYWKPEDDQDEEDIKVILIKEFRSPVSNTDGFIHELVGGSSFDQSETPMEVAIKEVQEETGLALDGERLKPVASRQVYGTLLAHHVHLFAYRLDDKELKWLRSQKGVVHGNIEDSEQTLIEVVPYRELCHSDLVDWATLGQVSAALELLE